MKSCNWFRQDRCEQGLSSRHTAATYSFNCVCVQCGHTDGPLTYQASSDTLTPHSHCNVFIVQPVWAVVPAKVNSRGSSTTLYNWFPHWASNPSIFSIRRLVLNSAPCCFPVYLHHCTCSLKEEHILWLQTEGCARLVGWLFKCCALQLQPGILRYVTTVLFYWWNIPLYGNLWTMVMVSYTEEH